MLKHCFSALAVLILCLPGNVVPANSTPAIDKTLSCDLIAPSTFSATWYTSTTARANWSSVSGAIAYRLKVYDSNGLVSNTVEYGTSTVISGLNTAETYECHLASICEDNTTSNFVVISDVINP